MNPLVLIPAIVNRHDDVVSIEVRLRGVWGSINFASVPDEFSALQDDEEVVIAIGKQPSKTTK